MDDICVGNFLFADDVARDEGYDELRGGDHGQHCPSCLVRNHTPAFLSGVVLTGAVLLLIRIWYFVEYVMFYVCIPSIYFAFCGGRRHYHGPAGNAKPAGVVESGSEKDEKGSVDNKDEGVAVSHEITN